MYPSFDRTGGNTLLDLRACRRIVVKVGTSSLTYDNGKLNLRRIERLSRVLADLKNAGHEIVLVTSGAVGAGAARLGWSEHPRDVAAKQVASAVGQSELMNLYSRFFGEYGHIVAQLLLTRDVVESSTLRENVTHTFMRLLETGVVPIVNENDTVSTFELAHITTFGDNDTLAATCALLTDADLLVILSDIDGLYDADPRENEDARRIPVVREIDDMLLKAAGGEGTSRGTGGMLTKLNAAKTCLSAGIPMVITCGENPEILYDIFNNRRMGTIFVPEEKSC
jgi:glutamate 5-kinase